MTSLSAVRALALAFCVFAVAGPARAAPVAMTKMPAAPVAIGGTATLAADGVVTLRGAALVIDPEQPKPLVRRYGTVLDGNRLYVILEFKQTDDAARTAAATTYNVKGITDPDIAAYIGVAAIDLTKGDVAWRARIGNPRSDATWAVESNADNLYFRVLEAAYAIAKPSGRYRWIWNEDAHGTGLNARYLFKWKFVDGSIIVDWEYRVDFEMHPVPLQKYELDAATGLRVYHVTRAPKIETHPIYVWEHSIVEYPGDRPSPAMPTTFDGVMIERTTLIWSKTTLEGIILNPELAILPQITAVAQKQTVGGKHIQWKYVIDIDDAARTFPPERMRYSVLNGYKDPVATNDEILYWPLGEFHNSGEKIVAAELAKTLGAATLPKPTPEKTALQAAPLFVFRDMFVHERASIATNDYGNHLKIKWGPYVFYQLTRDWSHGYYKMEGQPD